MLSLLNFGEKGRPDPDSEPEVPGGEAMKRIGMAAAIVAAAFGVPDRGLAQEALPIQIAGFADV